MDDEMNNMNNMNDMNNQNSMDNGMNNEVNQQPTVNDLMNNVNSTLNTMKEMDRNNINNSNVMNNPEFMSNLGSSNNMNTPNVNGNNFRNMNGGNLNGNTNVMNTIDPNRYSDQYVEFKEPVKKGNKKTIIIIVIVVLLIIIGALCATVLLGNGNKKEEPKQEQKKEKKDNREYGVVSAEEKKTLENRKKIVQNDVSKIDLPSGITKEEVEELWMQFKEDYGPYYWLEISEHDPDGNEMISITNNLKVRLNNIIRTFNSGDYYKIKCSDVEQLVDDTDGICGYTEGDELKLDQNKKITNTKEELDEMFGNRTVYALDSEKVKEKYNKYFNDEINYEYQDIDIYLCKRIHYDSKTNSYLIYNRYNCQDAALTVEEGKYHKLDSVVLNGSQLVLNSYTIDTQASGTIYHKVVYIFKRDNEKNRYTFVKRNVVAVTEKNVPQKILNQG